MFTKLITTFTKSLTALLIVSSLSLTPIGVSAQMAENQPSEIEVLYSTLIAIGGMIASSPVLTDNERLTLLTQLVSVSTAIMQMQTAGTPTVSLQRQRVDVVAETTKETATRAGLDRVLVVFNPSTNAAAVGVTYGNRTSTTTYNFPEVLATPGFDEKMIELKRVAVAEISNRENVRIEDVDNLTFVTARNPVRERSIAQNSITALSLVENFAQNSVVNSVVVAPANGVGSISINTDQDESLVFTLTRERDSEGQITSPATYTYNYSYYASTPGDIFTDTDFEGTYVPRPKMFESVTGATERSITAFLMPVVDIIPFASRISNFDSKLIRFMVQNPAVYESGTNNPPSNLSRLDCYSASDKVVITEFVKSLIDGLEAQYYDIDEIISYRAPMAQPQSEFGSGANACVSRIRVF